MKQNSNSLENIRDLILVRFVEWAKLNNLSPKEALSRLKIFIHPSIPDRWDAIDLLGLSLTVNKRMGDKSE